VRERFATLHVVPRRLRSANIPATFRQIEPLVALTWNRPHHRSKGTHAGVITSVPTRCASAICRFGISSTNRPDHPFHLHGFFFQIVQEDGEPAPVLAWKDTVNVPRKSSARIAWLPMTVRVNGCITAHPEHHAMG